MDFAGPGRAVGRPKAGVGVPGVRLRETPTHPGLLPERGPAPPAAVPLLGRERHHPSPAANGARSKKALTGAGDWDYCDFRRLFYTPWTRTSPSARLPWTDRRWPAARPTCADLALRPCWWRRDGAVRICCGRKAGPRRAAARQVLPGRQTGATRSPRDPGGGRTMLRRQRWSWRKGGPRRRCLPAACFQCRRQTTACSSLPRQRTERGRAAGFGEPGAGRWD